jgi:hypothetical protein
LAQPDVTSDGLTNSVFVLFTLIDLETKTEAHFWGRKSDYANGVIEMLLFSLFQVLSDPELHQVVAKTSCSSGNQLAKKPE